MDKPQPILHNASVTECLEFISSKIEDSFKLKNKIKANFAEKDVSLPEVQNTSTRNIMSQHDSRSYQKLTTCAIMRHANSNFIKI